MAIIVTICDVADVTKYSYQCHSPGCGGLLLLQLLLLLLLSVNYEYDGDHH